MGHEWSCVLALVMQFAIVWMYSQETVTALEEAIRGAEKMVGRCPDMEPLLVTARDRLQVNMFSETHTSRNL